MPDNSDLIDYLEGEKAERAAIRQERMVSLRIGVVVVFAIAVALLLLFVVLPHFLES